jgi:hypothetical protein
MKTAQILSGLILIAAFAVHTFVGGPEVYAPLQIAGLDPVLTAILSTVWHIVTATLALIALAALWLIRAPNPPLALLVAGLSAACAALFLGFGLVRFGDLLTMPQWTIFAAAAAAQIWALAAARR